MSVWLLLIDKRRIELIRFLLSSKHFQSAKKRTRSYRLNIVCIFFNTPKEQSPQGNMICLFLERECLMLNQSTLLFMWSPRYSLFMNALSLDFLPGSWKALESFWTSNSPPLVLWFHRYWALSRSHLFSLCTLSSLEMYPTIKELSGNI